MCIISVYEHAKSCTLVLSFVIVHTCTFMCTQVTPCYPEEMDTFPVELKELLRAHSFLLHPDIRMVRSFLIYMREIVIKCTCM